MHKSNEKAPYEIELLSQLAHIEELTNQQVIAILKNILTAVGTGYKIDSINDLYQHFYEESENRFNQEGIENPNPFSDLWEFYEYWKSNDLSTYSSRRAYVASLYKKRSLAKSEAVKEGSFWDILHPDIVDIAKPRYENGQFADSVEAALKEINTRVKNIVKQSTGSEYDGADLMNKAFSANSPILILDDLETEDGKSIQKGYMQIFAGSMTGIRNPKAHSNIILEKNDAIHLLHLASLLLTKVELANERLRESTKVIEHDKGMFIRLEDTNESDRLIQVKELIAKHKGSTTVTLVVGAAQAKQAIRLPNGVKLTKALIQEAEVLFGKGKVKTL